MLCSFDAVYKKNVFLFACLDLVRQAYGREHDFFKCNQLRCKISSFFDGEYLSIQTHTLNYFIISYLVNYNFRYS